MPPTGFPIVLTADRTLMARLPLLLDGMATAALTTRPPAPLLHRLLARPVAAGGDLRAREAPLGLRRIEAALRAGGFTANDVAVVPPERLGRAIGPATRVVGLGSGDPLGLGMNSTTTPAVFGGRPITSDRFQALAAGVRARVDRVCPEASLVVGGPGAWQFRGRDERLRTLGVDAVVHGYAEANAAELFRSLADRPAEALHYEGQGPRAADIPSIVGATVMGTVELSRGCGWGCRFCTLSGMPMVHLPPETILADAATNLAAGRPNLSLASEDVFRYGAAGAQPRPGALIGLLARLREFPELATLAIDHANVATLAAWSDDDLRAVRRLLIGDGSDRRVWVNLGIESAIGRLVAEAGGAAKLGSAGPEGWADLCREQVERLIACGYLPLVSLVVGLPGETPDDVEATLRWVDRIADLPVAVVPMLYAPTDGDPGGPHMTRLRWTLMGRAMATTLDRLPQLYRRDHRAAGTALWRRALVQLLGHGHKAQWRLALRRRLREAPA